MRSSKNQSTSTDQDPAKGPNEWKLGMEPDKTQKAWTDVQAVQAWS